MLRRTFLRAGAAGMALSLAQGPLRTQSPAAAGEAAAAQSRDTDADLDIVMVGVDGSDPSSAIVDKYLRAGANVGFYDPNLAEFSQTLEFLDSDPRIKLAKSYIDILANKAAGKVSMVIGLQNSVALEEAAGNDWRNSRPPRTQLRQHYELGSGSLTSATIYPIPLAAACLIPRSG
jgi:hypothetical protein